MTEVMLLWEQVETFSMSMQLTSIHYENKLLKVKHKKIRNACKKKFSSLKF